MGFVEHEIPDGCLGEERHIGQPGGQDLQLTEVGQQDAGLPLSDVFLGAALLGGCQGTDRSIFRLGFVTALLAGGEVSGTPGAGEPVHAHFTLGRRGSSYPLGKGDARATQHVPQPVQLVVGEGVHRVDEDRRQPLVNALVTFPQ